MNGTVVCKLTGSGNDFLFVDGRINPADSWEAARIEALCDRRHGIGADGFGVLEPGSAPNRVRFHFFNSDGGRAPMCGNGSLCATRTARWLELVDTDSMVLETDAGEVSTRIVSFEENLAEFELGKIGDLLEPEVEPGADEVSISQTVVAVPHLVVVVKDVESVPLEKRGRELRRHVAFEPDGVNVNFVSRNGDKWRVRTYERGVEGETLACGTGTVACAAVLLKSGEAKSLPMDLETTSGKTLTVSGSFNQQTMTIESPSLRGEARPLFRAIVAF